MTENPTPGRRVAACLLIIGNEILSGRTQDLNLAYIAKGLNEVGIQLREARVIPDVPETIIATLNAVRAQFDYVFTTGGIGPTHDDITAECVARAFGVDLVMDPEAKRRLEAHYAGGFVNEARMRMARVPEGASLIDNPVSAAPGFQIGNVLVLPGVPRIMQAMFDGVRHRLGGGVVILSRSVSCGLPESLVAKELEAVQTRFPDLEIGSYPYYRAGKFGTSLVMRGPDAARLDAAAEEVRALIRAAGGEPFEEPAAEPARPPA